MRSSKLIMQMAALAAALTIAACDEGAQKGSAPIKSEKADAAAATGESNVANGTTYVIGVEGMT